MEKIYVLFLFLSTLKKKSLQLNNLQEASKKCRSYSQENLFFPIKYFNKGIHISNINTLISRI